MKARKIFLKEETLIDPFTKKELQDENGKPAVFSYRQQLWLVLRTANPNEPLSTDELMKRAQIQKILEGAEDNKDMFLDESQFELLKKTLEEFRWLGSSNSTAEMIEAVRSAEEVALEVKGK